MYKSVVFDPIFKSMLWRKKNDLVKIFINREDF